MAPVPEAEKRPDGLNLYWSHVWDRALKVMKDQGSWDWELKPLLDEYVFALRGAEDARNGFKWLDRLEDAVASEEIDWLVLRTIATGLPGQWDRHTKRAQSLADQLALTPRGRKAAGIGDIEEVPDNPFDGFDEVAQAREQRAAGIA